MHRTECRYEERTSSVCGGFFLFWKGSRCGVLCPTPRMKCDVFPLRFLLISEGIAVRCLVFDTKNEFSLLLLLPVVKMMMMMMIVDTLLSMLTIR